MNDDFIVLMLFLKDETAGLSDDERQAKIGIKEAQFQVMNWKVWSTNPDDDDDQSEKWILGSEY